MRKLRLVLVRAGRSPAALPRLTPPLGLIALAAYVRERFDAAILIVDRRLEHSAADSAIERIAAFAPDIVGFSAMTPHAHLLPELTRGVRRAVPRALLVLGGPCVSNASKDTLMKSTQADLAVAGEGETALERIIEARLEDGDFSGIPGLIRTDASGEVLVNPGSIPPIEDVDGLPFPAYDLIDVERYFSAPSAAAVPPRPYVAVTTSRGCPYHCAYCHRIFGKRFRGQSAERMADDLQRLAKTYGVSEIEFLDDVFNHDANRVVAFADELHRRNLKLNLRFPNGLRADALAPETADALVAAGTYIASCALESGSPRIQQAMGKRLNIRKRAANPSSVLDGPVRRWVHGSQETNDVVAFGRELAEAACSQWCA